MKILFFGDSITDMNRNRDEDFNVFSYGAGYPYVVQSKLSESDPKKYEIINRGISGNRSVDLYARIKADVWNLHPDVLSILIGINDIWHEINYQNGVDIDRYEKIYDMILSDTLQRLPDAKIILCEPFVLKGSATEEKFDQFNKVREYALRVEKLADKYGLYFLPLQEKFDEAAAKHGAPYYLYDGVHPSVAGATLIGNEWVNFFKKEVIKIR